MAHYLLFFVTLLPAATLALGAVWVDICKDSNGGQCCAAQGMQTSSIENNKYWINTAEQSWESHHTDCLLAGMGDVAHSYRLVKFGSRLENYCLVQYIIDKYGGESHKFAIGLKSDSYTNVFTWQNAVAEFAAEVDNQVPAFTSWAPNSPSGQGDCVFMTIGETESTSGLWVDGSCTSTTDSWSICERNNVGARDTV